MGDSAAWVDEYMIFVEKNCLIDSSRLLFEVPYNRCKAILQSYCVWNYNIRTGSGQFYEKDTVSIEWITTKELRNAVSMVRNIVTLYSRVKMNTV